MTKRKNIQPALEPVKKTKAALVLELLQCDGGATLAELVEATGSLPHTTRAALTACARRAARSSRANGMA
ncbi:DUF3489 domain-containing protein [Sphingomonas sp.]|jgi:hypothetical protein|uniref:DUF3489 domain-containing protein n=1 Tax=Sphingomonas sp. TaxID=28214 RepID=UPI002E3406A3|nr:DUF3489 domain-containing protein [Sphingomonas sp.]HEX4694440.1 DUF3489 domain-containing protein [Sphingomonas sp.]